MNEKSIYLTVRVDINYPDSMSEQDAVQLAVQEFDYDFKLFSYAKEHGISIDGCEMCGIND